MMEIYEYNSIHSLNAIIRIIFEHFFDDVFELYR